MSTTTTSKITVTHTDAAKGRDDLEATVLAQRADGRRFRARIRRNAYDFQSYAVVETWTDSGWTQVHGVRDLSTLSIMGYSYVTRDEAWKTAIARDAKRLLELAATIVP